MMPLASATDGSRHTSLLDDLADDEDASSPVNQPVTNAPATAVSSSSLPVAVPAHTPLAKYLASRTGAVFEETADASHSADEANSQSQLDGTNAEQSRTDEVASLTDVDSSDQQASASTVQLLAQLTCECAAPMILHSLAPQRTLAHRTRLWCVRVCAEAATAAEHQATPSRSERTRQQRVQVAQQLNHLRRLHLVGLVLALVQVALLGLHLSLTAVREIPFAIIAALALSVEPSALSVDSNQSSHTIWVLPSISLLLLLAAFLNAWLTFTSLRRCIDYHHFASSFLLTLDHVHTSESTTKRLILTLMEREVVRRGYQITSAGGFLPPIERMEHAQLRVAGGGGGRSSAQADIFAAETAMRTRVEIQRLLREQTSTFDATTHRLQEIGLAMELNGSPSSDFATSTAAADQTSSRTSLPSIIELKNMRARSIDARCRMMHQVFQLLEQMARQRPSAVETILGAVLPSASNRSGGPLLMPTSEHQLASTFHALNVLLTRHLSVMESFSAAPLPDAPPKPTDTDISHLSASRRVLHQSLVDTHNSLRSAQLRLQLAMERETHTEATNTNDDASISPLPPPPPPSQSSVFVASTAIFNWYDLLAALQLPSLTLSDEPSSSLASVAPLVTSAAPAAAWNASLSSAFASDVAYLRQLLKQLHRNLDALDVHRRRVDADLGIEPEQVSANAKIEEPMVLAQSAPSGDASSSNADASVTPADLAAAILAMRRSRPPEGMGALFEGSGQFEMPTFRALRGGREAAPASASGVSVFTILSELKCVLDQRKPTYEYFVATSDEAKANTPTEE